MTSKPWYYGELRTNVEFAVHDWIETPKHPDWGALRNALMEITDCNQTLVYDILQDIRDGGI